MKSLNKQKTAIKKPKQHGELNGSFSNPTTIVASILDEIIGKVVGERATKLLEKVFCNFCGSNFNSIRSIFHHLSKIHKTGTFKCIICSSDFIQPAQLRVHFAEHGEQERAAAIKNCGRFVIFCEKCGKGFKDINELFSLHSEEHAYDRIPCSGCDASFHTTKFLIFHYQKKHLIENRVCIKCEHCPNEFATPIAFKRHTRREHANAKIIYSCCFCNFTHEVVADFKDHLLLKHYNDKVYKCPASRCPYKAKKEKQYNNHMKSQHPKLEKRIEAHSQNNKRTSGPAGSQTVTDAKNPQRGTRPVRDSTTTPGNRSQRDAGGQRPDPHGQTDSKKIYCKCCNKQFRNKTRLRVHMLAERKMGKPRVVNNDPEKSTPSPSAPAGRSGYQNRQDRQSREHFKGKLDCSLCKRSFSNTKSLLDHNRSEGHLRNIKLRRDIGRSRPPPWQNAKPQEQNPFGTNTPNQEDVNMLVQTVLQQVLLANKPQESLPVGNIPSNFTTSQRINMWDNNQAVGRSNNLDQYNVPKSNQRTSDRPKSNQRTSNRPKSNQRTSNRKRTHSPRPSFGGSNRNRGNSDTQRGSTSAERRERGSRNTFRSDRRDQSRRRSFSNTQSNSFELVNSGKGRSSLNQERDTYGSGQTQSNSFGFVDSGLGRSSLNQERSSYGSEPTKSNSFGFVDSGLGRSSINQERSSYGSEPTQSNTFGFVNFGQGRSNLNQERSTYGSAPTQSSSFGFVSSGQGRSSLNQERSSYGSGQTQSNSFGFINSAQGRSSLNQERSSFGSEPTPSNSFEFINSGQGRSSLNQERNSFGSGLGFVNSGQGRSSINQERSGFGSEQTRHRAEIGYTYYESQNSGNMDSREKYRY